MLQRVDLCCLLFQGWGRCVPTAVPQACEILYSEAKCVFILTIIALHEGNPWWTRSARLLAAVAVEQAKSRAEPRLSAQHRLSYAYGWQTGTAPVGTSKTMSCCPFPVTSSPAPCPWCRCFPLNLLKLQIANSVLGPLLSAVWLHTSICREMLIQLHITTWDFKFIHGSWISSAGIEFGLLSYFCYLTQSIYQLTAETQSQPHKPPHVIFDSTNLWEGFLNPIRREANFQKKRRSDLLWGNIQKTWASLQSLSSPNKTGLYPGKRTSDPKVPAGLGARIHSWVVVSDL